MSEMVERAAAALWARYDDTDCNDYAELVEHRKKYARELVRAVIESMRESTHAMQYAGRDCISARATWAAMIDEALK